MSDDPTPRPDPLEDRLRATFEAEADRHPLTPDLAALRARGERTIVDLHPSPRRNRARLLAVAAVIALLAGVVGVLAVRSGGDDDEPVITDDPPATGYHLPGAGWEVQGISALPVRRSPGTERVVEYSTTADDVDTSVPGFGLGSARIFVHRVEDDDPLGALAERPGFDGARTVTRGEGDETREYVVVAQPASTPEEVATQGGILFAATDDRLLSIDWSGPVGEDDALALADGWWASGGEAVALDPATGLERVSDVTYPGVEPAPVDEVLGTTGDAALQVLIAVEAPEGWTGAYTLSAPGQVVPSGFAGPEAGAAAGLGPDEVGTRLPAEVGGPAPAWESPTGIVAEVPGAVLGVPRGGFLGYELSAGRARELWAALEPVSTEAWVGAGADAAGAGAVPDAAWADTLATTDATRLLAAVEAAAGSPEEDAVPPIELTPRDGTNPAAGRAPAEVGRLVADAVLAFVGGPGPVDADLFAPLVTFAHQDDPGDGFATAVEDVAADAEGASTGAEVATQEAWSVLWAASAAEPTRLLGDGGAPCPPLDGLAADPAVVVVLQELAPDSAGALRHGLGRPGRPARRPAADHVGRGPRRALTDGPGPLSRAGWWRWSRRWWGWRDRSRSRRPRSGPGRPHRPTTSWRRWS